MDQAPEEIKTSEQLASVIAFRPWRFPAQHPKISLRIDGVDRSLSDSAEMRMNFWLGVCGCQAGALFVFGSLAWVIWGSPTFASTFNAVLYGSMIVLGAGITGKFAAMVGARLLLIADAAIFSWRIRTSRVEQTV